MTIEITGKDEFNTLRPLSVKEGDVFLTAYDITDQESFNHISHKLLPCLREGKQSVGAKGIEV